MYKTNSNVATPPNPSCALNRLLRLIATRNKRTFSVRWNGRTKRGFSKAGTAKLVSFSSFAYTIWYLCGKLLVIYTTTCRASFEPVKGSRPWPVGCAKNGGKTTRLGVPSEAEMTKIAATFKLIKITNIKWNNKEDLSHNNKLSVLNGMNELNKQVETTNY